MRRDLGSALVHVAERHSDGSMRWSYQRPFITLALTDPGQSYVEADAGFVDGVFRAEALLHQGDIAFYPAGTSFTARNQVCRWLGIQLDPGLFAAPALATRGGRPIELRLGPTFADPFIASLMRGLEREVGPHPADRLLVDSLSAVLAIAIARRSGEGLLPQPRASGLSPNRLRRVTEYIDAHLHADLSLSELASVACLSPWHFSRSFAAAMGVGPQRYVLGRRVEVAKRMLADGEHSIAEIALRLGFTDQSHLTNVFRKETGATPARFRAARRDMS
jgi:AraC family transcriptional regulator